MVNLTSGERYELFFHNNDVYIHVLDPGKWVGSWPVCNVCRQPEFNKLSFVIDDQIYFFQGTDIPDVFRFLRNYPLKNNPVTAADTDSQLNPLLELCTGRRYAVKVSNDWKTITLDDQGHTLTFPIYRYYKSLNTLRIRINGVDCEFRQIFENSNEYELTRMTRYTSELVVGRRYKYDAVNLFNIWFQNSFFPDDRLHGYVKEITKEKVKMTIDSDTETIYTFEPINDSMLLLEGVTYASR